MRTLLSFFVLVMIGLGLVPLRAQDVGQVRRYFRDQGVSLITPSDTNPQWRQAKAAELPPGVLWAGQSLDQSRSITVRVVDIKGDDNAFAQTYAARLQEELGRAGLKVTTAATANLGPWSAWKVELSGHLGKLEASQVSWLIAANHRIYDLSCLVGGPKAEQDPLVLGFAKGFEFITPPDPAPRAETWEAGAGSMIKWVVAAGALLLCGGMGLLRNHVVSGWALGTASCLLGLSTNWWWTMPAAVVGALLLGRRWGPAGERRLEVFSIIAVAASAGWTVWTWLR
jgi:hypothetical protein